MGKRVLVPDHPSNIFFKQFTNALLYTGDDDFAVKMSQARAIPRVRASLRSMHGVITAW